MTAFRFCRGQAVRLRIYSHTRELFGLLRFGGDAYAFNRRNYYCLWWYCEVDGGMNGRRVDVLSSSHWMLEIHFAVPGFIRTFDRI
mgnify:CR=1 FL=1